MKEVIDIDGNLAFAKDCRKYNGKNYVKGKHCILMKNGKWYRIDSSRKISYDNLRKEWVFDSVSLHDGIVGYNENGSPILGKFTLDPYKSSVVIDLGSNSKTIIMDESLVDENKLYVKSLCSDFYIVRNSNLTKSRYKDLCSKKIVDYNAEYRKYNSDAYMYRSQGIYEDNFVGKKLRFEGESRDYIYEYLNGITWGCEFETSGGKILTRIEEKIGLIPLKDGSLRRPVGPLPIEYATVVLSGKKGIKAIVDQCNYLEQFCKRGLKESLHVHIGGIKPSKEYAVSMYALTTLIQDELYDMFPKAYKSTREFKGKDYCKPLVALGFGLDADINFKLLHKFLVDGNNFPFESFGNRHPLGDKWNCKSRYHILNLNPLLFGGNKTVEWRIHNPTFNSDKVINWIYILNAISKYANRNKDYISTGKMNKNVSLRSIIAEEYSGSPLLTKYLFAYIAFRKRVSSEAEAKGDRIGKYDISDDSLQQMKYPIKSIIK